MSSTQEKLEGKFEIEPGQILTIEANGYLKGTIISNDEDTLILSQSSLDQLIDSAKREGAIEELKKLPSNRHESSGYCNAEFFIDSEDRWKRIKELEQSEENE